MVVVKICVGRVEVGTRVESGWIKAVIKLSKAVLGKLPGANGFCALRNGFPSRVQSLAFLHNVDLGFRRDWPIAGRSWGGEGGVMGWEMVVYGGCNMLCGERRGWMRSWIRLT